MPAYRFLVIEPTVRRLRRGEAEPGALVEYLGETQVALMYPEDRSRLIFSGHPGRIDHDWEGGYGGHVVVIWHGLEDTDESNSSSGYGWDEDDGTYPGLGLIDRATYDSRTARLDDGRQPLD